MKGHNIYPIVILPIFRHLQEREYTCGPASLRIILETLRMHDRYPTEEELAELCGTNEKNGTDPDMMVHVLKHLGIRHDVFEDTTVANIEKHIRSFELCLVDFQAWDDGSRDGHYSVIFGFDETHLFVADPYRKRGIKHRAWGFRRIRKDLFDIRWHGRHSDARRVNRWLVSVPFVQSV